MELRTRGCWCTFTAGPRARHYNRFRYYDPGIGRYVSADPIGQAGGVNVFPYARNNPARFLDPFGLEEGSASNRRKRQAIADWAADQSGSTGWSKDADLGPQYPSGHWKCSKFSCDAAAQADADTSVTVPDDEGEDVTRCPTAAELARGNVPNWRLLGSDESPEPGDIAASAFPDASEGETGHAAVVIEDDEGGTTTIGAHKNQVGPPGDDRFYGAPKHRRYTGD